MRTRRMTIADYEAAYELWTSEEGVGLRSLDDSKDGIEKFLTRNPGTCFVSEEKGKVTGTILCGSDGRRGYIYHAMVAVDKRNIGIGRALVEAVLKALKEEGINKTALVVFADNINGRKFWESVGFSLRKDLVYMDMSLSPENK